MEAFEVKRYYRWLGGPDRGIVEVYLAEDDSRIWFESGASIEKTNLDSMMFQTNESEYQSTQSKAKKEDTFSQWESMLGTPSQPSIAPQMPVQKEEKSPLQLILEKQKKFNNEDLQVSININFPSPKAIEFMSMMFDEDEVIEEIIEFVYKQVTSDQINNTIKNSIRNKIYSMIEPKEEE